MSLFNRRSIMKGMLGGAAIGVGIPTLDMFLNGNGNAYAEGTKLPTRFGTYFWGLGLTPKVDGGSLWVPQKTGKGWDVTPELKSLESLKDKVSVLSGFNVPLDGRPNLVHYTGQAAIMTGTAPMNMSGFEGPTFDVAVADAIGGGTRFRSIDMTPEGSARSSNSTRTGRSFATPDTTPKQLYARLFGEGFQDPNSDTFEPDHQVMLRKSVLSAVSEQRHALISQVGSADKQRLDQYFTSLRQLEEQMAVELEKPARREACVVPKAPLEGPVGRDIYVINKNNKIMAELTAMALACNQTKVFNVVHTSAASSAYLPGDSAIYHLHTHDEGIDHSIGYQPISAKLAELSFRGFAEFIQAMDAIKEGDGTLLDHSFVMAYTDTGYAKIHAVDNIPMFFAGAANGAHKTGQHIVGRGDPISRVALTAQQIVGLPVGGFGTGSMKTSKSVSELMA